MKKGQNTNGLYLFVNTNGSKHWWLKYRFACKEKTLSIGPYPSVSLAEARAEREKAKKHLRNFVDPSALKKQKKLVTVQKANNCFENVAKEWWEKQLGRWSPNHVDRVWTSLEADVFPLIGMRPVNEITTPRSAGSHKESGKE